MLLVLLLCLACSALGQGLSCVSGDTYISVYAEPRGWQGNTYLGPISRKTPFEIIEDGPGDYQRIRIGACGEMGKNAITGWALLPNGIFGPCRCPPPSPYAWPHVDASGLNSVVYDAPGAQCMAGARPGVAALRFAVQRSVRGVSDVGIYNCRSTATGGISEHSEGRAWDIGVPRKSILGNTIANWLVKHAGVLGIQSVIWNGWGWGFGNAGWSEYCSEESPCGGRGQRDDHTTHVHVSLNWASARSLAPNTVLAELSADPIASSGGRVPVAPRVAEPPVRTTTVRRATLRPRAPVRRR